jgi:hypothetical protein
MHLDSICSLYSHQLGHGCICSRGMWVEHQCHISHCLPSSDTLASFARFTLYRKNFFGILFDLVSQENDMIFQTMVKPLVTKTMEVNPKSGRLVYFRAYYLNWAGGIKAHFSLSNTFWSCLCHKWWRHHCLLQSCSFPLLDGLLLTCWPCGIRSLQLRMASIASVSVRLLMYPWEGFPHSRI